MRAQVWVIYLEDVEKKRRKILVGHQVGFLCVRDDKDFENVDDLNAKFRGTFCWIEIYKLGSSER